MTFLINFPAFAAFPASAVFMRFVNYGAVAANEVRGFAADNHFTLFASVQLGVKVLQYAAQHGFGELGALLTKYINIKKKSYLCCPNNLYNTPFYVEKDRSTMQSLHLPKLAKKRLC